MKRMILCLLIGLLAAGCASAEVVSTLNHQAYDGNGSTRAFSFSFGIYAATDLRVICRTGATGVEAVQVLNSDYVLTDDDGDGDYTDGPGGTVTFVTAPALGVEVHLIRIPPLTQLVGLDNVPYLRLIALEDAIDKLEHQIQYLQSQIARSPRVPITEGLTADVNLPSNVERAGGFLHFDDDGNADVALTTATTVTPFWAALLDDPNLAAALVTLDNDTFTGLASLDPNTSGHLYNVVPLWSVSLERWIEGSVGPNGEVQPWDAQLQGLAGHTPSAASLPYWITPTTAGEAAVDPNKLVLTVDDGVDTSLVLTWQKGVLSSVTKGDTVGAAYMLWETYDANGVTDPCSVGIDF